MKACRRSRILTIPVLLGLLPLLLIPISTRAQAETGTVKSAPLSVYAEMSTASDVVATLPPGKSVQITFSVMSDDGAGAWCSISDVDSSEKLGFVHCDGLDRQIATITAAAEAGPALSTPANPTAQNGDPTSAQKDRAIATTGTTPRAASQGAGSAASRCDALQRAAANGQITDVNSILRAEPALVNCRDAREWTPLHYAATSGRPDTIEVLLQRGAQIDALDRDGDTPLEYAASAGSVPATDMLLKHHAAIEKHGSNGYTPLQSAVFKGYSEIVQLLLENGADIESRDGGGYTPLNTAAWFGRTEVVALLLAAHANANTQANDGMTPLHGAAAIGSVDIASLLLKYGGLVNADNAHGFTPLHSAAENGQAAVAEFLIAHGAKINAQTGNTPLRGVSDYRQVAASQVVLKHEAMQ
jgi:ankyrin repeat protein